MFGIGLIRCIWQVLFRTSTNLKIGLSFCLIYITLFLYFIGYKLLQATLVNRTADKYRNQPNLRHYVCSQLIA